MNRLQELEIDHGIGPLAELIEDLVVSESSGGYFHISVEQGVFSYQTRLCALGVDIKKTNICTDGADYAGGGLHSFTANLKKAIKEGTKFEHRRRLDFSNEIKKDYWDFSRKEEA
jgi:hypothetical protein